MIFTVIGYEDNGNIFADHVEAHDYIGAFKKTAEARPECTLVVSICGQYNEPKTIPESNTPGSIEFPGESTVDASTYLELF